MENRTFRRQNLSVSIKEEFFHLITQFQDDTFQRSRSRAIEQILAEYFLEHDYIEEATFRALTGFPYDEREETK